LLVVLRFRGAVILRAVLFRDAAPFGARIFRDDAERFGALAFREAAARLRAGLLAFRETAVRFRPEAALRVRLVFFLPRGGIFLLRELGSQSAAGEANPLPAFVNEAGRENTSTQGVEAR
jgi:hypothetical protein